MLASWFSSQGTEAGARPLHGALVVGLECYLGLLRNTSSAIGEQWLIVIRASIRVTA